MTVQDEPGSLDESVIVSVVINGFCVHADQEQDDICRSNRRPLRGTNRSRLVAELRDSGRSSSDLYYRKLGELSNIECVSGNTTSCQTAAVTRQALHEVNRKSFLHNDMVVEVNMQRESLEASMPGYRLSGYIQTVSMFPFTVTFYCEAQVKAYIAACKADGDCTVHFDATGSIIRHLPGQKMPLYYCLLLADGSLPIMDMLTTRQTATWLQSVLDGFLANVRSVNNGKAAKPKYIVTDQSFALMNACLRAFNNKSLNEYLHFCYNILKGNSSLSDICRTTTAAKSWK
jgi:hypothetical protein